MKLLCQLEIKSSHKEITMSIMYVQIRPVFILLMLCSSLLLNKLWTDNSISLVAFLSGFILLAFAFILINQEINEQILQFQLRCRIDEIRMNLAILQELNVMYDTRATVVKGFKMIELAKNVGCNDLQKAIEQATEYSDLLYECISFPDIFFNRRK